MPSAIVETPSEGDAINAPLDADLRNAASVRTPFQSVGNRLNFLEALGLKVFKLGGALTLAADLVYTIAATKALQFVGLGSVFFDALSGGVFFNQNVRGPLFTSAATGRANRRPSAALTGAGPFTIRPDLYDTFQCACSGAVIVNIDPTGNYVEGDTFRIVNLATNNGYTVTVKSSSGTITHVILLNAFTSTTGYVRPMVAELMRTAAGGWTLIINDSLV